MVLGVTSRGVEHRHCLNSKGARSLFLNKPVGALTVGGSGRKRGHPIASLPRSDLDWLSLDGRPGRTLNVDLQSAVNNSNGVTEQRLLRRLPQHPAARDG